MKIPKKDAEQLRELEESLWRTETRFDREYMETVLAPDFFEFGRSGRIYQREDTLGVPCENITVKLPLKNFSIHSIDQNVVLVTYLSEVIGPELEVGNRSSLWIKVGGKWQLQFHQGTPVPQ